MPEFISKVQHDNYEKGEFSDEKERTLDETLELIKTFPWDNERTLTEIQLTGPSITIQDEYVNYLKVGLYFGGKYCVYYLDNDNHLYERYVTNIDDVFALVTDFFNSQLDLEKFEKHLLNFRNQGHFITQYFEYRIKLWRVFKLTSILLLYGLFFLVVDVAILKKSAPLFLGIAFLSLSAFLYYILFKIYYHAIIYRHSYLQISKGNDSFQFGYNIDEIKVYKKSNIDKILYYESRGNRNPNLVVVYEIIFVDGTSIKFSNMLISYSAVHDKFSDKMDNFHLPYINGKKSPLKML